MTLTQTADIVKKAITFTIIFLVVSIVGFIGYKIWYAYYIANLPPVEEKPDMRFGLLPEPDFPSGAVSPTNFSYSIDTVTGGLPKIGIDQGFDKIIKVYFISPTFASLLSSEKSLNLAEKFNFNSPAQILSDIKYRFEENNKILDVNLDTGNFSYQKYATPSGVINLPQESLLIAGFEQILNSLGVYKNDFQNGRKKVTLLKSIGNNPSVTSVQTEAIAALISLWPAAIDNKQIYTADYNKSSVSGIVLGNSDNLENYISIDFIYYPIDATTFATYLLQSPQQALEDLKGGKGVVIVEPQNPRVSITSVSLGYYLPAKYTPYLLPIYIFEGPGFVAYTPAINNP